MTDALGGSPGLLLTGARVLDPSGERWLDGLQVLVAGQRITQVAVPNEIQAPPGNQRIDLAGLHLLPGLIDLHSHLLLRPYHEATWEDQVLKESLEMRTIRAVTFARATLEAGFTTLRDLGTEGAGFADVALRDAIAQGLVAGPRIFAATRAIVATGGYGPSGFDPRWEVPKGAQVADGISGILRAVREQIASGANWIKVYADGRRVKGSPSTPTFSQEELAALVSEAKSAGVPVAAHATTDEGIRRAVRAGVATIEHGYGASDEVLALMSERGVALCPTLAASEAMARYGGRKPESRGGGDWTGWHPRRGGGSIAGSKPGDPSGGKPEPPDPPPPVRLSKSMFTRALEAGVTIACGSDAGVFTHGDNAREIELMVSCGMSPVEALRAATVTAAQVLGRASDLGRIEVGALADLIAVRGDALREASSLRGPVLVVKEGRAMLDRRPQASGHQPTVE